MRLSVIFRQILEADVYALNGGNPNLIEFPKENYVASFIDKEKRVELSPRDEAKEVTRIRSLVNDLKNHFEISEVIQLAMNTFDIHFSPRENFDKIKSYIKEYGKV